MARGSVQKRCNECRRQGLTGRQKCSHRDVVYSIVYYIGRKQKSETVGPNKKDAERLLAQRISEINNGTYFKPSDTTLDEVAHKWIGSKRQRIKPSTLRSYTTDIEKHILPKFGNELLSHINREEAEVFFNDLRAERAADTVNNVRLTFLMVFNYAKSLKYINFNPIEEIKPFPLEHKEMDFLKPEEIQQLLKFCREPFKTIFLTAVLTGMRRGEVLGLQWGDIDWHNNTVFVRRGLYWLMHKESVESLQRWRFIEPKSKRSRRAIVMSPMLKKALEIHRIMSKENPHDLVFCNKVGNPMDPDHLVHREFQPALKCAGIRKIRWHDLRHTYTSLLISQGENIKFIQSQLGHSSIQTTIDRYGHLMPIDRYSNVGERLDNEVFQQNQAEVLEFV